MRKLNIIFLAASAAGIAGLIVLLPTTPLSIDAERVSVERTPIQTERPNLNLLTVAHRGASKYAPENTLPAIQYAIDLGFDYVELDVRYTSDGVPVLMHDKSIDRTTNGSGPVNQITLAELQALDAGSWFHDSFSGTRVPTLEEALGLMQGKICAFWDPKASPTARAVEIFRAAGFDRECMLVAEQGLGGQHDAQTGQILTSLWPEVPIMPVIHNTADLTQARRTYPQIRAVNIGRNQLSHELVEAAHVNGLLILSVLLVQPDNPRYYQKLMDDGVDVIMLDNIDSYYQYRNIEAGFPEISRDPRKSYQR